jgi:DNA-binding NtrC family response regulator
MPRVLVIDDDIGIRTVIKTVLERQGFEVAVAADGRSGIAAVQEEKFDVLIVDIFMPDMDGLESIRAFNKVAPAVPVIAMSGFLFRDALSPAPDFLAMATKLGAACSLQKPFRSKELLRVVTTCLGHTAPAPPIAPDTPVLSKTAGH